MAELGGAVLPLQEPLLKQRKQYFTDGNFSFLQQFSFKGKQQEKQDLMSDPYQPLVLDWSFGHLYLPVLVSHNELQIGVQYPKILA